MVNQSLSNEVMEADTYKVSDLKGAVYTQSTEHTSIHAFRIQLTLSPP